MSCSQCGHETPDGANACPNCGASLATAAPPGASAAPPGAGTPLPVGATPAAVGGGMPAFSFNINKLSREERITGIATLVLFISLFLPWFTYNFGIGTVSVDGLWHGWMYLTLILCLAVVVFLVLRAGYAEMPFKLPMANDQLLLIGTGISFVLTILGFVDKPGGIEFHGIGWGFGAFLGLIAAVVAVAPLAWPVIQKQMNKS